MVEERSAGRLRVYIGKTRGATAACAISLAESDAVVFAASLRGAVEIRSSPARMGLPARIDACRGCLHEAAGSCNGPRHGSSARRLAATSRPMNFQRERFSRRQTGGRRLQPDAVRANGPRVPRPLASCRATVAVFAERAANFVRDSSHGNAWPARAAAAPLLMRRRRDASARATPPAPVDATVTARANAITKKIASGRSSAQAPLRSPQIGRQGSTWARFLEGGGEPPELFQAIVPFRSEPVPIRVLPLPPLWKGVDSQLPKLNSRRWKSLP